VHHDHGQRLGNLTSMRPPRPRSFQRRIYIANSCNCVDDPRSSEYIKCIYKYIGKYGSLLDNLIFKGRGRLFQYYIIVYIHIY